MLGSDEAKLELSAVNERAFRYYRSLRSVHEYVTENYSAKITLGAAAQIARMERTYFSAFFHRKVGIRFRDWLGLLRVHQAMRILAECDQPVPAVGRAVGFEELRTFERAFKKFAHQTPAQYRRVARPC